MTKKIFIMILFTCVVYSSNVTSLIQGKKAVVYFGEDIPCLVESDISTKLEIKTELITKIKGCSSIKKNSKNVKYICTKDKKICKTLNELSDSLSKKDAPTQNISDKNDFNAIPKNENKKEAKVINIQYPKNIECKDQVSYECLPIVDNLSYLSSTRNILSYYFANLKDQTIIDDDIKSIKNNTMRFGLFWENVLQFHTDSIGEFEIDDFINNFKKRVKTSITRLINDYNKNPLPSHVRITNLNIPVSFHSNGYDRKGGYIIIEKDSFEKHIKSLTFQKEDKLSKILIDLTSISDFTTLVNNKKIKYGTKIAYNSYNSSKLKINEERKLIVDIGKKNKGKDIITEITVFLRGFEVNYPTAVFEVSSFKLKSINKRFVADDKCLNNILDTFLIKDDKHCENYILE